MGYRLNVKCNDTGLEFYGTKLYGYVNDERTLKSYKYLKQIGKFNGNEHFDYRYENKLVLSFLDFSRFIKLYFYDLQQTDEKLNLELRELSKQPGDKTIWWG